MKSRPWPTNRGENRGLSSQDRRLAVSELRRAGTTMDDSKPTLFRPLGRTGVLTSTKTNRATDIENEAADTGVAATSSSSSRRLLQLLLLVAALVVLADQLLKAWVIRELPLGHRRNVITGALQIVHTESAGILGGRLAGLPSWAVASVTTALLVGLLGLAFALGARRWLWLAGGLALGGTVSNLIDRVRFGTVTDLLVVGPIRQTNLADLAVVIGGAGLVLVIATRIAVGSSGAQPHTDSEPAGRNLP